MALHAVSRIGGSPPVSILVTGDEEIGSATSREVIREVASGADAVLVLEGAAEGGALKTARKGMADYRIDVRGRAAHAGLEPERGVNAVIEAAHQIVRVAGLADGDAGTTVVPTVVSGGRTTNTVPASATIRVDVRAWTAQEQSRVDAALRALVPVLDGAVLDVSGGPDRPPLEVALSAELYVRARAAAERVGIEVPDQARVGGVSDGNLTADLGVRTLDGLGAVGGGAHADDEHVLVDEIPRRVALLTALIEDLT